MNIGNIHNYYESLVGEYLMQELDDEQLQDQDFLEDVACLALNRLPARYVRHDVDMAFFLSTTEREQMQTAVMESVGAAIEQVQHVRRRG